MRLHLPFDHLLPDQSTILIAGMGGGFDVFCGLPLYFELTARGHRCHLASVSFAPMNQYTDSEWLSPTLVGVSGASKKLSGYHPERFLARWFNEVRGDPQTVWCIEPTGALTIEDDLRLLTSRLSIDTLIIVDGGVDSLTRGDEEHAGTVLEDYCTLAAAVGLSEIPRRIIACIGMGIEGDVSHRVVFENIATATKAGGFYGTSALVHTVDAFKRYEEAVNYAHFQPGQQPSVINASIISAARGEFGDYHLTERTHGSELWISPLMNLYWFFDVDTIARQNLFIDRLRETRTAGEAAAVIYDSRNGMQLRPSRTLPLS